MGSWGAEVGELGSWGVNFREVGELGSTVSGSSQEILSETVTSRMEFVHLAWDSHHGIYVAGSILLHVILRACQSTTYSRPPLPNPLLAGWPGRHSPTLLDQFNPVSQPMNLARNQPEQRSVGLLRVCEGVYLGWVLGGGRVVSGPTKPLHFCFQIPVARTVFPVINSGIPVSDCTGIVKWVGHTGDP